MTDTENPVLSIKNLTTKLVIGKKPYVVVDNLSFDLIRGKTLAIVGESGCGKSMSAFSIMRILPHPPALPPEGEVIYQGKNLLTLPEKEMRKLRGSKIAMIFQDPMSALNPVYTIGYQLGEVARLHLNLQGKAADLAITKALADVGIDNPKQRLDDYPHQYSGGMLQRVMIAMALLGEPDILIADEPTTALDVTIQKQILNLMIDLQKERGMAILLITHDMGVVAEVADEVIVMYATQKVEEGSARQIFAHPAHPYSEGLFKARPTHPIKGGEFYTIKGNVPTLTSLPSGCHFHPRCPYVMPICKQGAVPNFATDAEDHLAKCWLYKDKS